MPQNGCHGSQAVAGAHRASMHQTPSIVVRTCERGLPRTTYRSRPTFRCFVPRRVVPAAAGWS
ncbi:hypothetical protein A176_001877 [Myxococcus hansupus]|uniref:Uncharacterized protein n=1 Tax=Pseudomyxococcus hansupus TaxID=1297742 RepID=A0A0H4WUI4_9BACT|nr:hypothetical protein A176_001877 [Myxococcus hansupus]